MKKSIFNDWNTKKKKIDMKNQYPFINEREVWWCCLGKNIGDEEFGKGRDFLRPVLILKKFNKKIFYGIPLSTQIKKENRYYISTQFKEKNISALISQMKLIDAKRLFSKMGKMSTVEYKKIKSSFIELF